MYRHIRLRERGRAGCHETGKDSDTQRVMCPARRLWRVRVIYGLFLSFVSRAVCERGKRIDVKDKNICWERWKDGKATLLCLYIFRSLQLATLRVMGRVKGIRNENFPTYEICALVI